MKSASDSENKSASRRDFLAKASAMGAAALFGLPRTALAEPPPEITKIRMIHAPSICLAPQLLAEELLRLEGFSEVEYVELKANMLSREIVEGRADISMVAAPEIVLTIDASESVVVLGGIHAGCYELFGNGATQRIRDLKGKRVVISGVGSPEHTYVSSILAYVGIDPRRDVTWVQEPTSEDAMRVFMEGEADGFLAFPPQPQDLRAKRIGHTIVDTTRDRPWSQYFCCMVAARREFVARYPAASKRALRAMLKAADICAQDPERVAAYLVSKKYEPRYEIALEVLKGLPYRRWRDAHPEDTLRFHALRLHEVGMIKSAPEKLIAQGTDWRFLNELKKELKA